MKKYALSVLFFCCLVFVASTCFATQNQVVAGAGPSTKVVQSFFNEFSSLPAAKGITFEVPEKSAKHAGGIKCSNYNLFGRTGRPLNAKEKALNKDEIFLAKVPIAFVIGDAANVDSISLEALEKIYTGEITNWKEVGGADAKITLVGREPTEALFMELKESYDFFKMAKFDKLVTKDGHVINFMKSPQGMYGLGFGAKSNFKELKILKVPGMSAGVRLGLVFDLKNSEDPFITEVRKYAASKDWQTSVVKQGLFAVPIN